MRDSPVRVGAYEVKLEMYKSCASVKLWGEISVKCRVMSGHVG